MKMTIFYFDTNKVYAYEKSRSVILLIESIVANNKDINYGDGFINAIEWENPPPYAELLINKSLSKYGFSAKFTKYN